MEEFKSITKRQACLSKCDKLKFKNQCYQIIKLLWGSQGGGELQVGYKGTFGVKQF